MIDERRYLQDALYDWVAAVVEEMGRTDEVIWRDGKGVRPVPPFIAIEFVGSQTLGLPNYSMVEVNEIEKGVFDDGVQKISQPVRKTLTMYAFGQGCIDLLETVKASIYRQKYIDFLYRKNLVIPDVLDVIEGADARGNEIESSAHFDFVVTFIRVITDDPGWIERVDMTNKLRPGEVIHINEKKEVEGD